MSGYVTDIWRCRYFWLSLVWMDLQTRYRRTVLGLGWSLLQPVAMTAVLCLAFHHIFGEPIQGYAPYVLSGLACWNYFVNVSLQGCHCFFQGEAYIRQFPVPLAVYPLRTALGAATHFLIALSVVMAFVFLIHIFAPSITCTPGNLLALASLVPSLFLLFVLGWSVAMLTGIATVYFRDIQHLAEVFFQILFYATPIIYRPEVMEHNALASVLRFNPLIALLQLIREPLLQGRVPNLRTYAEAVLTVLMVALAAIFTLLRCQARLVFKL